MSDEPAEAIVTEVLVFSDRLSETIRGVCSSNLTAEQVFEYRRLAGRLSAYLFTELLQPLCADKPRLLEDVLAARRASVDDGALRIAAATVSELRTWLHAFQSGARDVDVGEDRIATIERAVLRLSEFLDKTASDPGPR